MAATTGECHRDQRASSQALRQFSIAQCWAGDYSPLASAATQPPAKSTSRLLRLPA